MMNQDSTSSPPPAVAVAVAVANVLLAKRKRGRPRKDETITQFHVNPEPDSELIGQVVSGVVEGSFEAGYFLNVKVKDSDKKLRGLVFIPGKVNPVTPENDVAPLAKLHKREDETNKNQTNLPNVNDDHPMKDAVTDLEISDSARALSSMPQESNGEEAVQEKEVIIEKEAEGTTRGLVDFFPNPETVMTQPSLVMLEKEKGKQKSPGETTRGFDLMADNPVCQAGEKVPEELQLELGNKSISSGDNINSIEMETNPKSSVSKSGFIANLFEGEDKKVEGEEEEATPSVQ